MSSTDLDMAAIMAAANDALGQPNDAPPAEAPQAWHCQTGCGRAANVVLVRIADSDLDILCDVCAMMMFLSIAAEVQPATPAATDPAGQLEDTGQLAAQLAGDVDGQAPAPDTEASTEPSAPEG